MIQPKPSIICDGCKIYGEQCHCLCHKKDIVGGVHEILYDAGPAPTLFEYSGEREWTVDVYVMKILINVYANFTTAQFIKKG